MWPEIELLLIWGHQQTVVQIAPARSADENIRALCFTPDGTMDDRVALISEPCRFKGTVDFVIHLDAPPPTPPPTPDPRRGAGGASPRSLEI